jgi:hypothetical protein
MVGLLLHPINALVLHYENGAETLAQHSTWPCDYDTFMFLQPSGLSFVESLFLLMDQCCDLIQLVIETVK